MLRFTSCLAPAVAAYGGTPVYQISFDKPNAGWTVVQGTAAPGAAVPWANNKSLRLEGTKGASDVCVHSAPVSLMIGKHYALRRTP